MNPLIFALASAALFSVASSAPAPALAASLATPSPDSSVILKPFHPTQPFHFPDDIAARQVASAPRAVASGDVAAKLILTPVKAGDFYIPADGLARRATPALSTEGAVTPSVNVTLDYATTNTGETLLAQINATMKYPSVLLENINSVTKVDCAASSVAVTFGNAPDFEASFGSWPSTDFILFTNHLGDCDTDNERGLYIVNKVSFDNATFTVTAAALKSTFDDCTDDMDIAWTKPIASAAGKRAVTSTFLGDFPGTVSLSNNPTSKTLSVSVNDPKLGGNFAASGRLKFNFFKMKPSKFYIDVDLSVDASANVKVSAGIAYNNDVYSFSPASVTVSAFSIPGILDVGPMIDFALGVELAVSGKVDISADLSATLADGHVHLDLLDSSNTVTSGWTPVYTHQTNISATIDAQINPYVELTAQIGAKFLNGLLDLSTGVKARPTLVNDFSINGQFNTANNASVTFPTSTEVCTNGLWYSSAFDFTVTGFVTQFYSLELYKLEVPIWSKCWSWVPGAVTGGVTSASA